MEVGGAWCSMQHGGAYIHESLQPRILCIEFPASVNCIRVVMMQPFWHQSLGCLTGHPAWWLESLCHGGLSKPSYSLVCHWLCYSLALVIEKMLSGLIYIKKISFDRYIKILNCCELYNRQHAKPLWGCIPLITYVNKWKALPWTSVLEPELYYHYSLKKMIWFGAQDTAALDLFAGQQSVSKGFSPKLNYWDYWALGLVQWNGQWLYMGTVLRPGRVQSIFASANYIYIICIL